MQQPSPYAIRFALLPLLLLFSPFGGWGAHCTCVRAQTAPPPSYGTPKEAARVVGLSTKAEIDQLMFFVPGIGSPSREQLVRQNIKSYMMPIRQMTPPSTEWAYALAGCLEYYNNLNNNFKDNLSPDYITLSLARRGSRPTLDDGLQLMVTEGTVTAAIVPYGSPTIPNAVFSVPRVKVANYGHLFRPETRPRTKVFEVRNALSRGNPILIELRTDAAFSTHRGAAYSPAGAASESHFLTVVGYDSDAETFELRGTFGRLWAGAGYVSVSYDDFGRLATNGYVLIPR